MAQGRELPSRCSWGLRPPPSTNWLCPVCLTRNGLPTDKPAVTEDVNIYQKYIAR